MNRRFAPLIPAAMIALVMPAVALAAPAEGGSSPSILPTNLEALVTSITTLVIFVLLLIILGKFAWGPILGGLKSREDKIRQDLADAEKARADAQASLAEYKQQIAGAEAKVREMFANATKDAEATATRIKMQAQQEAEDAKNRATKEIDEARKNAIVDVQNQAASLATLVASKILKRNITEQDQSDLVRASLDEMARK